MRILIVALGLSLLIPAAAVAQAPAPRHTFVPAHKSRLSIDFGTKQALRNLPQRPADCSSKVIKHRHEPMPLASQFVELPIHGGHQLRPVPVTPCPAR